MILKQGIFLTTEPLITIIESNKSSMNFNLWSWGNDLGASKTSDRDKVR